MVLESIAIFIIASLVLVKPASYAVRSISSLARYLLFSAFFAAFVLAGFISTFPELFIGINAALLGEPLVGVGTIIGTNIADLTIALGIIVLVGRKISVDKVTMRNNLYFVVVTSLPVLLMIDGALTTDDGILLVVVSLLYIWSILRREKIFGKDTKKNGRAIGVSLATFVLASVLLFVSAHYMVESGVALAGIFGVPLVLVGLIFLALGSILPELTFSLRAVLAKHKEIALGALLGNVAIDSTFSIGIVALIAPIRSELAILAVRALFMILAALVVGTLLVAGRRLTWQEAFLLFYLYAMFLIVELLMRGIVG